MAHFGKLLHSQFFLSQHLRKNNFITENNEVVCSLKDFNKFRECVHRSKAEIEAAKKRVQHEEQLDDRRLLLSRNLFEKVDKKNKKFSEIYEKSEPGRCKPPNPTRHGSMLEIIQRRKEEQECQKRNKFVKTISDYNARLNEIEKLQNMKRYQMKERTDYKNLDIIRKQTFVSEKNRK